MLMGPQVEIQGVSIFIIRASAAAPARRRLLKGVCLCAKNFFDVVLRWLLTQLGLLGGH
jgi:hypothetical protein